MENPNNVSSEWRFTWESLAHIPTLRLYLFNPQIDDLTAICRFLDATLRIDESLLLISWLNGEENGTSGTSALTIPVPRVFVDPERPVDVQVTRDYIEAKLMLLLPVEHPMVAEIWGSHGSEFDRRLPLSLGSGEKGVALSLFSKYTWSLLVAIFLRVVAQADSYRTICEFFQHSLETISRNFHKVLRSVMTLSSEFIVLPDATTRCSLHIRRNRNFYPFFKDAIGAVDDTHIPAVVAQDKQNRYRNRKDFVSQNVMTAVNFEREFVYVASGWEGSAADMRVLRWAVEEGQFNVPSGKYYLVDSGYANTDKFIAPIRGVRYHLSNYRSQEQRHYSGPQELYNHRHAQLRNVVERSFGILKERFRVLTSMKPFAFTNQADIVVACCVLHNFISRHCGDDAYMNMTEDEQTSVAEEDEHYSGTGSGNTFVGGRDA